jgi:hypothetical protein
VTNVIYIYIYIYIIYDVGHLRVKRRPEYVVLLSATLNLHNRVPLGGNFITLLQYSRGYNTAQAPQCYTCSVHLVCIRVYSVGSSENGNIYLGGTCSKTERPSASK